MNAGQKQLRIVILGGTGQVGTLLARHFHSQGHMVTVIARQMKPTPWHIDKWNGRDLGKWVEFIDGADMVINLAGRSVNCRYTQANRREILESRVYSTAAVGKAIAQAAHPPRLWMNASTATIYRHALDRAMDEAIGEIGGLERDAPSTWRFSIDVATAWERSFQSAQVPETRKIALRSAMIMSPDKGGVFDTLRKLVQVGLGGRAASGLQYVSWIHEQDFVNAIDFLIARDDLEGAINVSSPGPLPNRDFMAILRDACGMPFGPPAAKWMLELGAVFLRTETELILKSRRVIPTRLLEAGFRFSFPRWQEAAHDLIMRWRTKSKSSTRH